MASMNPTLRPLSCWKSLLRHSRQQKLTARTLTTYHRGPVVASPVLPFASTSGSGLRKIKTYPPPPSPAALYKEPIKNLTIEQIGILDPTGTRTQLFSKLNSECAKVGDILLVRQRNGDPFAGVCINIRRRGVDTAILLRNELTRVGVEMWYKVYSPNVEGIEVVQRKVKRARRARLTYMRKKDHDVGSVQNIVYAYTKQKDAVRSGNTQGSSKVKGKKKKAKK